MIIYDHIYDMFLICLHQCCSWLCAGDADCLPDAQGRRGELRAQRAQTLTKRSFLSESSNARVFCMNYFSTKIGRQIETIEAKDAFRDLK